jgi:catechol 2,3-dioxygenase-like lactoylglutathione lyase family enzyme
MADIACVYRGTFQRTECFLRTAATGILAGRAKTVQSDPSTLVYPANVDLGEVNMLAYVTVGTNNVKSSAKFYDAALAPLGLVRTGGDNSHVAYGPKNAPKKSKLYVTKPYNKKPATFGNGTMISLAAKSRRAVDGFYAAALVNGGTDEGKPGPRPAGGSNYVAYARDPDGNKICAYCAKVK